MGTRYQSCILHASHTPTDCCAFWGCTYVVDPNSTSFLPFVAAMVPHVSVGDYTNTEAAQKIISTWTLGHTHWFMDAGFSSKNLIELATEKGGDVTMSIPELHSKFLWDALSFSLPPGYWRAAVHASGLVASIHCGDADGRKRSFQRIMTTNWMTSPASQSPSDVIVEGGMDANRSEDARLMPRYTEQVLMGRQSSSSRISAKNGESSLQHGKMHWWTTSSLE